MNDIVERELDRIGAALTQSDPVPRYDELYAAQQALKWTLDPDTYKAPFDLLVPVSDTPEDLKGCPAETDHSGSLDISGHRAASR